MHVLRLCSVYEPEATRFEPGAARFDPIGGMQNHTASLSRALDDLGVRQTVLTSCLAAPCGTTPLGRHGTVHRVGVRTARARQLWALYAVRSALGRRLRRRAGRPDVVHAHQGEDLAVLLLGLVAAAIHRCPLVVTVHCSVRHTLTSRTPRSVLLRLVGGAVERFALRRAAAVLVLVPRTARMVARDGVDPARIHVLPSGFEPSLFDRGTGVDADPVDVFPSVPRPRVGYVGRYAEQKRPDVLIRAFGLLRTPAELVLVGDGPWRDVVDREIATSPARDRIHRHGFVPHAEVPDVLASLDVLVLPSAYEEMGSVLVEAMASGLPTVASDVGGIPDVVEHGVTGMLVPPLDVAALAETLEELLADPAALPKLGEEARRQASKYAWPGLARRVSDRYAACLAAAPEDA